MKRSHQRLLGACFWALLLLLAAAGGWRLLRAKAVSSPSRRAAQSILQFATAQDSRTTRVDPSGRLRPGDPVFLAEDEGGFRQAGVVRSVQPRPDAPPHVQISWYAWEVPVEACQMFSHHSSGRLSEAVSIMFPPEKRERIRRRIAEAMAEHGEALTRVFVPLVQDSLKQALPAIEAELRRSVDRHRDEIDAAVARWNRQWIERQLLPLAKREILPIVKRHAEPPAEKIGRAIWDRASLFRFGWRALYDRAPLPQQNLVREEWDRFVAEEAMPVLEAHMDEIVIAIQRSLKDIATNPEVRRELANVAEQVARDPQSRALVTTILKETLVENQALREAWKQVWTSPRAQRAIRIANDRLEPIVRQIGDDLFGSEAEGIDPDFARVLRSQILRKDRRWVVAWHTGANNGVIERVQRPMAYPVVYVAQDIQDN